MASVRGEKLERALAQRGEKQVPTRATRYHIWTRTKAYDRRTKQLVPVNACDSTGKPVPWFWYISTRGSSVRLGPTYELSRPATDEAIARLLAELDEAGENLL